MGGLLAVVGASFALGAGAPPAPVDVGPAPEWSQGIQAAEAAVRARLIDPESARFEWPYGFFLSTRKPMFGKREDGWLTCGFVNAHNRMGGFTGRSWVYILESRGVVTNIAIGENGEVDVASVLCEDAAKKKLLPPAPVGMVTATSGSEAIQAAAQASAMSAAAKGGIGIGFVPTPYGLYLLGVADKSPASAAGLKPGETVEAVNGISVKGLNQAQATDILARAGKTVTFTVVGVGDVKITKP